MFSTLMHGSLRLLKRQLSNIGIVYLFSGINPGVDTSFHDSNWFLNRLHKSGSQVEDAQFRAKCQSCNQPFKYSFHVIKTKGCEVPTECEDCERGESWMLVDV